MQSQLLALEIVLRDRSVMMKEAIRDKEKRDIGPVFVVGMNGSGTTMLADCLNHHPELYIFPLETRVIPHFISKLASFGDLSELPSRRNLAQALGKCRAYWEVNGRNQVVLDDKMLSESGFTGVLKGLYGYFASREKKTRWGDKTPMYLQHMELLASHIPKAKFVHIYRDGRDAAQSFHRRWGREPRRAIYRWKKTVKLGRKQGSRLGPSRYMEISYENLTADPKFHMKRICGFLDLPFHSNVLKSSMPYLHSSDSKKTSGRIIKNSEKWRTYFSLKQLADMEQIAGNFLGELGYAVVTSPADEDPPKWRLRSWQVYDLFQNTRSFFQEDGLQSIGIFLRRAKDAIIQARTNRF